MTGTDNIKLGAEPEPRDHVTLFYLHRPNARPEPIFGSAVTDAIEQADPQAVVTLGPILIKERLGHG
jgi:hypothetical protein